ncbi:MAG: hypothetical protein F4Y90_03080 [Rhodothermaceae bacterium]|nr:hypothetical protein [Rhodothermaceae bacterium]
MIGYELEALIYAWAAAIFWYGIIAVFVNAGMAAFVAQEKNYPPVIWFFLTLFFPMALFAVLGLPVKETLK